MQDYGAIPGLAGRVLGAAGEGGRLRGYPPPLAAAATPQQGPVKCPRCDSTNTKFCYYNNYNLAQPRHFCKSCRRYWTKGGVLRNVPVGGGCRRTKRSSSSSPTATSSSKPSGSAAHKDPTRRASPAPRSGCGSSTVATAEASTSAPFPNSALLTSHPHPNPDPTPSFDPAMAMEAPLVQAAEFFPDTSDAAAESFTGLMPPSAAPAIVGFSSFSDPPPIPLPPQLKAVEELGAQPGFTTQAVAMDPGAGAAPAAAGCGLAGMDWLGASVDPALFDLGVAVDPAAAYWNHGHWGDSDPGLYLP